MAATGDMMMELEVGEEEEVKETINADMQHPLMMEDVLDKIFPYFTDKQNLTSFRLVNTTWNKAVCRSIKDNLRWTIGKDIGRNEFSFPQCMSSSSFSKDDLFAKLHITQYIFCRIRNSYGEFGPTSQLQHHIDQFLMAYGTNIVDLDLHACSYLYNTAYLKPNFLPNLTRLRLYDLTDEALRSNTCSFFMENRFVFPKLKHIRFDQRIPSSLFYLLYLNVHEDSSTFCYNLLKAAPACTVLDINLQKTTIRLLASPDPDIVALLGSLTSFNTLLGPGPEGSPAVFLILSEFKTLIAKCPKLVKLSTSIMVTAMNKCICQVPEEDIYRELAPLAPKLQELNLELHANRQNNEEFVVQLTPPQVVQGHEGDEVMDVDQNVEANYYVCQAPGRHHTNKDYKAECDKVDSSSNEESQHGVKRDHDALDDETKPSKKLRQLLLTTLFPYFPKLKKLVLKHFHLSNNFDVFNNMPALTHVDLDMKPCNPVEWPIIEPSTGNPNVKYFRFRGDKYDHLEHKLALFAEAFPCLTELDVVVPCNCALRIIFMYMPRLKRLHLNSSEISDAGFTGIRAVDPKEAHFIDWSQKEPKEWRDQPYIGNLVDLQHLTYNRAGVLTHFSVDHGIIDCKNLTYLKLPAYEERPREGYYSEPHYNYDNCPSGSLRAQICPILKSCPRLVKLDVSSKNVMFGYKKESNSVAALSSSSTSDQGEELRKLKETKYTVNEEDLEFIKIQSQFPYFLEIIHDKN